MYFFNFQNYTGEKINHMKPVIINGDYLAFQTFAGVSRYASEILTELDPLITSMTVELITPEYATALPHFQNIKIKKIGNQPLLIWKNTTLPSYVKKHDGLFVDLTQAFPIKIRGITCVHDCIPELISSAYLGFLGKYIKKPIKLLQRRITIKRSLEIITVSYCSKKDISKIYNIDNDKITVIGNAWQHIKRTPYCEDVIKKYHLKKNEFYFSLGSRVKHKNLEWIIAAAEQNPNSIFVVSGENNFQKDFEQKKYPSNIIFTGFIKDGEVRSLMANCKAFIFPSLYEGFGIPPMEALAEKTPIIIANSSCLPEIYESSAHYINPYCLGEINLNQILAEKVDTPDSVLAKYSWRNSAKALYKLIQNNNK